MTMTKLFSSITQTIKEKRLMFKDEPPAAPAMPEAQKEVNKELTGKDVALPEKWEEADAASDKFLGKVKVWLADANQSEEFKSAVKAAIDGKGGLKEKYNAIKWDKIEQKDVAAFKLKIQEISTQLEKQAQLDAVKKALLEKKKGFEGEKLTSAKDALAKAKMDTITNIPEGMKVIVKAAILKGLDGVEKEITLAISGIESQLKGKEPKIDEINAAMAKIPADATALLANRTGYPDANKMVLEVDEYCAAVTIVCTENARYPFLEGKTVHAKTQKCIDTWNEKFKGWMDKLGTMPKQDKLVEAIKKAQTEVILTQVVNTMDAAKQEELRTALKLPKGAEITPEKISSFFQKYASFEFTGAEAKSQVAELLAKAIQDQKLDVGITIEGGADSEAIGLTAANKPKIIELAASAKRIQAALATIGTTPQLARYQAEITALAGAADPYAFVQTECAASPAAKEKWLGGGGVLNTLLAFRRSENIAGNADTSSLFKGTYILGVNPATAGGNKQANRYSQVSFLPKGSQLCASTTAVATGAPAAGPTGNPAQIEAANLAREKASLEAKKSEITTTTIPQVEATIKDIEGNIKVSTVQRIKDQIVATNAKIAEIKAKIAEDESTLDSTGIKAKADLLTTKQAELLAEEQKLKEIRDLLLGAIITAPTGAPGSTGELFDGRKFEVDATGNYLIDGNDHPLTKEEFDIVTGVNRPTEAYKKDKTKLTYVKTGIDPTISYDPATKVISGEYSDGTNKLNITYDIKTGERKVTLTGSLRPLLPTDDIEASKRAVIEAALMDGVSLTGLNVAVDTDPEETAAKTLKEYLIAGNYKEAIKLLVAESSPKYDLITKCVENLTADINSGTIDSTPLKPMLGEIISKYNQSITVDIYTKVFKKINGGDLTGALAEQLAAHKKLDTAVLVELIKVPGTPPNAESATIAALYIEKNFTPAPGVDNPTNIKAINAYTGKIKVDAVIAFIIANYAGNFDTPAFKPRLQDVFKEADKSAPTANFKTLFEKLYPSALDITTKLIAASPDGVDSPEEGAKVWAKYLKSKSVTELMKSGFGNLFTAGSTEAVTFVDTFLDMYPGTTLGTVNAGNKAEAQNILARMSASTNPKAVQFTSELIAAIKALAVPPATVDTAVTAIEAQEQTRIEGVLAVAMGTSTPAASYEKQAAAIKMFIGTGVYVAKDVTGNPQGVVREDNLKGKLAKLHFDNGKYAEIVTDGVKDNLVVPEQKEFMKYFDAPATLDETGMKYLVDNKDKITPKAIYALAGKVTDNSQKLRLYRAIGLEEKAAEVLSGVTDPAEKILLQAQMDLITKRYKEMTPAEQAKVKAELIKAYKAIAAAVAPAAGAPGTPGTSDSIRMRIVEQLFELSEHIGTGGVRNALQAKEILDLLDTEALDPSGLGHLNTLGDKALSGTSPLSDVDILILRAKELRALIELTKLKDDPSCGGAYCNIDHIVTDLDAYNTALGTNPIETKYADQLLALYKDPAFTGTLTKKAEFGRIMLQAAKQTNDEKYLVERNASGAITKEYVKEADLTTPKEKTNYYTVMKNFLKAAEYETDNAKKIALIKQAPTTTPAEQTRVAEAYEKIATPEAQEEAFNVYKAQNNYVKIKEILSRPSADPKSIPDGRAETLIKSLTDLPVKVEIATARGFKKVAFEAFKNAAGSQVDITMLVDANAPAPVEILNALKLNERTITDTTTSGKKAGLLTTLKGLPEWAPLTGPEQTNITKSLS